MTRTRAANRPRVRLIWDELLGHRVPRALRELGFNTTYVGATSDGGPTRGSGDPEVIAFAQQTNHVIVTSNHDMMLLCDEAGQRFVWMDPRGRQFLREEQVLLCFRQIRRWEEILESGACVRALRTKAVPIESAEAARLANQRFRELRRRQRAAGGRRATGPDHLRLQEKIVRRGRGRDNCGLRRLHRDRARHPASRKYGASDFSVGECVERVFG